MIVQLRLLLQDSIVWGTVSDWTMVLITGITAYYLYRTLQSQKDVQETQTRLFEIESIRFRESIKPLLEYSLSNIEFKPGEKGKEILTIEVRNLAESVALEITSDYPSNHNVTPVAIPIDFSSIRKHLKKDDKPLLFHFLLEGDTKIYFITFTLTYQDISGTKYKQGVFCIKDSHGIEINPFLPEIIG